MAIAPNNFTQTGIPNASVPLLDPVTKWINKPWWLFLVNVWNRTGGGPGSLVFSTGMEIAFPAPLSLLGVSTIPQGWVLENGQAISRTGTSAALFQLLGTTWGAGDGVTTFNVPNRINKLLIGAGGTYALGTNYNVGINTSTIQAGTTNWLIKL